MCTKIELIDWLLYELFTYQILSNFHNKLLAVLSGVTRWGRSAPPANSFGEIFRQSLYQLFILYRDF